MRYLTKSRFTVAITCPAKLQYLDNPTFADANAHDEFLRALAEGGHQVGALAKCLFHDGVEIDAVGHDAQVAQTLELLRRESVDLFEAAIRVGRLFIRVDILRKMGDRLELFEVKAKSFDSRAGLEQMRTKSGIKSDFKPYIYDVAFQRHVLRLAFPDMTVTSHLILPDKGKVCPEAGLAQRLRIRRSGPRTVSIDVDASLRDGALARELLYVLPVDELIDVLTQSDLTAGGYVFSFTNAVGELAERVEGPWFDGIPGSHCKSCEFRPSAAPAQQGLRDGAAQCWTKHFAVAEEDLATGTVFDLYNFRGIEAITQSNRLLLRDLAPDDVKYKPEENKISLSHRQWLQCEESRHQDFEPMVIAEAVREKIESLQFPLHFIDFETATPALPYHAGMRPYELLFFQFSHHRIHEDGRIAHATQHLNSQEMSFPNFDSVRALADAIGADDGSVIHWWTHERTVLAKVRDQLLTTPAPPEDRDELIKFIESLLGAEDRPGRLVDLGQHVALPLVFLPRAKGSSSIKRFLPAILNASNALKLRYADATYGTIEGIQSLNFEGQRWVQLNSEGRPEDPYSLLPGRFNEAELDSLENAGEGSSIVANGGAAMIAYGLLQSDLLDSKARQDVVGQLLRYCELDTLAMVMAYEGLTEIAGAE